MASSESQGKTIALVSFVVLWIVSSVLAYVFYDKTDQLAQQASEARKNEQAANTKANQNLTQYREILETLFGSKAGDNHTAVMELAKKDLQSPRLSEQRRSRKQTYETYTDALNFLQNELAEADRRIQKVEAEKLDLEKQLKDVKGVYTIEVNKALDAQSKAVKDRDEEVRRLQAVIDQKSNEVETYLRRFGQSQRDYEQAQQDLAKLDNQFKTKVRDLELIIEDLRREREIGENQRFDRADGAVMAVLPSSTGVREVQIDLGSADGLRNGLTFGVYGRDAGGNPMELPKANVEIARVLEDHRAVARITREKITDPILPGDLLYNPIWSPGDFESIAFVGLTNLAEDDKATPDADNEAFKRFVTSNGGKIDAWVNLKTGKVMGKITTRTGWLVEAEIPEATDNKYSNADARLNDILMKARTQLRQEAREHGVRVISLKNFLNYMGYTPAKRSLLAGTEERYFRNQRQYEIERRSIESSANGRRSSGGQ